MNFFLTSQKKNCPTHKYSRKYMNLGQFETKLSSIWINVEREIIIEMIEPGQH